MNTTKYQNNKQVLKKEKLMEKIFGSEFEEGEYSVDKDAYHQYEKAIEEAKEMSKKYCLELVYDDIYLKNSFHVMELVFPCIERTKAIIPGDLVSLISKFEEVEISSMEDSDKAVMLLATTIYTSNKQRKSNFRRVK